MYIRFRKILLMLIVVVLGTSLFTSNLVADDGNSTQSLLANQLPVSYTNINNQIYYNYSRPISSHLYVDGKVINRVETISSYYHDENDNYVDKNYILVESYDEKFNIKGQRAIEQELPIWGGFHAGKKYNFLVFGQSNMEENDNKEVVRIVKYSKDWKRLVHASLKGLNELNYNYDYGSGVLVRDITVPFRAGSLRFFEDKDRLHIRTSRQMYKASDGLNHQANLALYVDIESMEARIADLGYASHSFNQFLLVDQDNHYVSVDHGDAYPRSIVFQKFDYSLKDDYYFEANELDLVKFPGRIGENYTGATVGGFEETSNGYLVAYNQQEYETDKPMDAYLKFIPKKDISASKVDTHRLTTNRETLTPHLVSTGLDGGYMLWNEVSKGAENNEYQNIYEDFRKLVYVSYDANGKLSSKNSVENAPLSDVKPIPFKNGILWYTTDSSQPIFYHLTSKGLSKYDTSKINKVNLKGWIQEGNNWYYYKNNKPVRGWNKISSNWYYMDYVGVMATGWIKVDGKWYYFSDRGDMQTYWFKDNNKWYYADSSGAMQRGWINSANNWYLFNKSGVMQTGWGKLNNNWYYMDDSGVMQNRWTLVNGAWYYMDGSGKMQTGWISSNDKWYFMNKSGKMQTGKLNISGKNYVFDSNGVMQ